MVNDIGRIPLISLRKAAELWDLDYQTVWSYATKGFKGRRLETCRVGRNLRTTVDAMQRFCSMDEPTQNSHNVDSATADELREMHGYKDATNKRR